MSRCLQDLAFEELQAHLADLPRFRAEQIWQGVHQQLAESYEAITTLPAALRGTLAETLPFTVAHVVADSSSEDGRTAKSLHRLEDGASVESVLMIYDSRATVCVSSQVGCAVGCPFCATGRSGFVRDLTVGEIVAQVLHAARELRRLERTLTNVVYMGMGEPFLNYDAVLGSIRILNDPRGFGLGARSFTVSTAGIIPGIERLSAEGLQVNLAVSLHAGTDELRSRLIPLNRRYPLDDLLQACRRYADRTHRRISFEVALMDGVNDVPEHAKDLAERLRGLLCHVNLIPYNPTSDELAAASEEAMQAFAGVLERAGIPTSVRQSMGSEIEAGCGQLRAREAPASP